MIALRFLLVVSVVFLSLQGCTQNPNRRAPVYVTTATLHVLNVGGECDEIPYFKLDDGQLLIPEQGLEALSKLKEGNRVQLTYKESKNQALASTCLQGVAVEVAHVDLTDAHISPTFTRKNLAQNAQ